MGFRVWGLIDMILVVNLVLRLPLSTKPRNIYIYISIAAKKRSRQQGLGVNKSCWGIRAQYVRDLRG